MFALIILVSCLHKVGALEGVHSRAHAKHIRPTQESLALVRKEQPGSPGFLSKEQAQVSLSSFLAEFRREKAQDLLRDFHVEAFETEGPYARVFRARQKDTDTLVALKLLRLSPGDRDLTVPISELPDDSWDERFGLVSDVQNMIWATDALRANNVPGVVLPDNHVYHLTRSKAPKVIKEVLNRGPVLAEVDLLPETNPDYACFIEPWMPWGTLEENLRHKKLDQVAALKCLADVANGLGEMHKLNVSHNRISTSNIMVDKHEDSTSSCRLSDCHKCIVRSRAEDFRAEINNFYNVIRETLVGDGNFHSALDALLDEKLDRDLSRDKIEILGETRKKNTEFRMSDITEFLNNLQATSTSVSYHAPSPHLSLD